LRQNREDEGAPTSQNTLHSTNRFTPPSQNHLQTTPPPKNPPSTISLEHHSLVCQSPQQRSPPHVYYPKSPPHTTPPSPQNPPTKHAPQHCSTPHVHYPKSPPHTSPPSLPNPPTEQGLQHRSPPHIYAPKSPPHTTPPLQNLPNAHALQSHSTTRVSSPMSPPYTPPPLHNPPNALKKQDAVVDKPSTNSKTIVKKFYGTLNTYKIEKSLGDLVVLVMTVKEFWQHGDKDYMEFEFGNLLVPKHVHLKFSWAMQKIHEWYYFACVYGLNFIEAKIPKDIFNTIDFHLHVDLVELQTIFHLKMLNITMMTVW
jgi:hypothetical protein